MNEETTLAKKCTKKTLPESLFSNPRVSTKLSCDIETPEVTVLCTLTKVLKVLVEATLESLSTPRNPLLESLTTPKKYFTKGFSVFSTFHFRIVRVVRKCCNIVSFGCTARKSNCLTFRTHFV